MNSILGASWNHPELELLPISSVIVAPEVVVSLAGLARVASPLIAAVAVSFVAVGNRLNYSTTYEGLDINFLI